MLFWSSALAGGAFLYFSGNVDDFLSGVWWSFLHLTDGGYLGDDQGVVPKALGTVLTFTCVVMIHIWYASMSRDSSGGSSSAHEGLPYAIFALHDVSSRRKHDPVKVDLGKAILDQPSRISSSA
jgi:hypothetical protein